MATRTDRRPATASSSKRRSGTSRKSGFGGTLLGLFIGIALGLALAAGVAYYLTKAGNPYQAVTPGRDSPRDATKESAKAGRAESGATEKPRFDFYKILPGVEEAKVQPKAVDRSTSDKATAERAVSPEKADAKAAPKGDAKAVAKIDDRAVPVPPDKQSKAPGDRFWLQAGSFSSQSDAEDLKARLAFAGWEATIQPATVPDRGVRYRVRLGPYDNTEALQRMKSDLASRGFDVAVIKF
jgi:cell division protein FtsN